MIWRGFPDVPGPLGVAAAGVEGSSRTPGRMGAAPATIHSSTRAGAAAQRKHHSTPSTLNSKQKHLTSQKEKLPPPAPIAEHFLAHELVDVEVEARRGKQAHLAELRREAPVQLLDPAYPHQIRRHAPEGDAALARA